VAPASEPPVLPAQQATSALLGTSLVSAGLVSIARSRTQAATPYADSPRRAPGRAVGLVMLGAGVALLAPLLRAWRDRRGVTPS
jgi:hypothetical protein